MTNLDAGKYYTFNVPTSQYCSCQSSGSACSVTTINTGVTFKKTLSTISNSDLSAVSNFNLTALGSAPVIEKILCF